MNNFRFKYIQKEDYSKVQSIYAEGLTTGNATFQTTIPEWEDWDASHHLHSRLGIEMEGKLIAWAALSPVSKRKVYEGVAEVSIYVGENYQGQQLGSILLKELIVESEKNGIWTLVASIFPENFSSIRIHEKNGFKILGRREKIAQLHGVWRDTVLMERRSLSVGF